VNANSDVLRRRRRRRRKSRRRFNISGVFELNNPPAVKVLEALAAAEWRAERSRHSGKLLRLVSYSLFLAGGSLRTSTRPRSTQLLIQSVHAQTYVWMRRRRRRGRRSRRSRRGERRMRTGARGEAR
jgi:hypothetical protein